MQERIIAHNSFSYLWEGLFVRAAHEAINEYLLYAVQLSFQL